MGSASGKGENAAIDAARLAIGSPLMEAGGVEGARGVLINITGSSHLSLHDVNEACSLIRAATKNDDAQVNFGVVLNESLKDEVKITVIATGFEREHLPDLNRRGDSMPLIAPPPPAPVEAPAMLFEAPQPEPQEPAIEETPIPDIDVPAYLRRDRRMYQ